MAIWDGIVSGVLGLIGGERANNAREDAASAQMAFQESMANSQYQRGVKDLEAAGLNPMLALMKGGAAAPQGAMAQVENSLGGAVTSAISGSVASETVKNLQEQNELLKAQQKKTESERAESDSRTVKNYWELPLIDAQAHQLGASASELGNREMLQTQNAVYLRGLTDRLVEQNALTRAETALVRAQVVNALENNELIKANTHNVKANTVLRELEKYQLQNRARHEQEYSDYRIHVGPFLDDAGKVTGSGASAARMLDLLRRRR